MLQSQRKGMEAQRREMELLVEENDAMYRSLQAEDDEEVGSARLSLRPFASSSIAAKIGFGGSPLWAHPF